MLNFKYERTTARFSIGMEMDGRRVVVIHRILSTYTINLSKTTTSPSLVVGAVHICSEIQVHSIVHDVVTVRFSLADVLSEEDVPSMPPSRVVVSRDGVDGLGDVLLARLHLLRVMVHNTFESMLCTYIITRHRNIISSDILLDVCTMLL